MNITARNALLLASALLTSLSTQAINSDHFVPPFLPASVSTVPSNGDTNPYGVAFVPEDFDEEECELVPGDILVSNFNNSLGQEGTGSTIVRVAKDHSVSTFFATPNATLGAPGTGLTTALEILKSGFVIVGSLPSSVTSPGQLDPSNPGSLLVIDAHGNLVETITDPKINGPWDMTVSDHEDYVLAFVSNVIDGTVIRIKLDVDESGVWAKKITTIASGYVHRADPIVFAIGPTGLVYDHAHDVLYVASTGDNEIFAVRDAATRHSSGGTGSVIYADNAHLRGPLAMIKAPNGHLLVSNGDAVNADPSQPSEIIEFTKTGHFVTQMSIDPAEGGAFGMAVRVHNHVATFATVDDNTNQLLIYRFANPHHL